MDSFRHRGLSATQGGTLEALEMLYAATAKSQQVVREADLS